MYLPLYVCIIESLPHFLIAHKEVRSSCLLNYTISKKGRGHKITKMIFSDSVVDCRIFGDHGRATSNCP